MFQQKKYYYLIELQYLGFRYHGWQKQKNVKTVQGTIEKAITKILGHEKYRTLGAGRTDAMVSANHTAFELFTREPVDQEEMFQRLNFLLPNDIRILSIKEVDATFNIIQHPKQKEYHYYFSSGKRNHPFAAPYLVFILEELDIELMKQGAKLFEGRHNFRRYTSHPEGDHIFEREITLSEIISNKELTTSFFPSDSYVFRIKGKGFLRHQVRMMMGTLLNLGQGTVSLEEIEESLSGGDELPLGFKAPASGLMLYKVNFE